MSEIQPQKAPPLTPFQKWATIVLWSLLVLVVGGMLFLKLKRPRHEMMQVLFHTPAFVLTDEQGKTLSEADLRGKPYICDFIFTTCGSACPLMSAKMAQLQKQTPENVRLISFTVNPEHDTPEVLKEYGARYGADFSRWHFLTGSPAQMTATVREMKIGFQAPSDQNPILHSEKFLLVDGDGNVRGIYDSNDADSMHALVVDATWLAESYQGRGS